MRTALPPGARDIMTGARSGRRLAMRWLALCAALALAGCASQDVGPTRQELKQTWESQNVFPAGYKNDLLAFMRTYLNDPTHIRNASVSQPQLKQLAENDRGQRYVVCVRYTARDSGGKYMPPKEGAATFVSGKLDRYFDAPVPSVRELCKDAAYAPFFELEKLTR
jgi:hypothetical protein